VPGNHDEFARQFCGHRFGGIEVAEEAVHTTADGRKLWVVHGDHFDGVIQCAKWLAYLGDNAYEFTLRLNRHLNSMRARLGLPYWSLSQYLKHKVKSALNYVTDFERAVAAEARQRGYQGVVCGHIHRPEMRVIDGTLYCNDGDWVESLSALVEHFDGQLELVRWRPSSESGRKEDEHDLERDPGASPTRDECVTQTSRARSIIVTYERKLPPPEASPA
jgi:UDP-2,3-diacylglucosamine pyrophosphatase LpxH